MKYNWPKILPITAGIVVLAGGLYYYASYYSNADSGSSEMSDKLQETGEIVFDMANILQVELPQSFSGLVEKENAGDFIGASEIMRGSLSVVDGFSFKNGLLKEKIGEFSFITESLNKKEVRESAQNTADILSRLSLGFEEIIDLERQLLNLAKDYYDALSINEETEAPDFIQINAKIAISSNNLSNLLGDFAVAANELNILLNGERAVVETEKERDLKIEDVALGQGKGAQNGDTLVVHYIGTLENGTKFDSSIDRDQPFVLILGSGQVIRGWEEGLLGMKIGGHRRLTIPPHLGYGSRGQGIIPPNATLIFEIDLLDIK